MRLIFAGTPEFARVALERLHDAGFEIALALTQPDRPAGRGMQLQASPVKQFAARRGIAVAQPRSLRLDGPYPEDATFAQTAIEAAGADAMVVAAYGLILPQWMLDAPRLGCLNIHASLLPRWRGAAPIHRAIEAGDSESGVTIMQMDAGLDTGDVLLMERVSIEPGETTGSLHDKLAVLGGRLVVESLELAACGGLRRTAQPQSGVTYARKIGKPEAAVHWAQPAATIERLIRAFDPFPGAFSSLCGETLKLWRAEVVAGAVPDTATAPGAIIAVSAAGLDVHCAAGCLRITQLQRAGGRRLAVAEFLRGFDVKPGMTFQPPPRP